jgi:hypothetical protein
MVLMAGARAGISFRMHRIARHPLDAVFAPAGLAKDTFSAWFEWSTEEGRQCIGLREDTSTDVRSIESYDEAVVIADACLSEGRIESPGPGVATFIEWVLVLNKVLLSARFAPAKFKWWVASLDLDTYPLDPGSIALHFIASVGPRLTKSAIEADGVRVGASCFSGGRR